MESNQQQQQMSDNASRLTAAKQIELFEIIEIDVHELYHSKPENITTKEWFEKHNIENRYLKIYPWI